MKLGDVVIENVEEGWKEAEVTTPASQHARQNGAAGTIRRRAISGINPPHLLLQHRQQVLYSAFHPLSIKKGSTSHFIHLQ